MQRCDDRQLKRQRLAGGGTGADDHMPTRMSEFRRLDLVGPGGADAEIPVRAHNLGADPFRPRSGPPAACGDLGDMFKGAGFRGWGTQWRLTLGSAGGRQRCFEQFAAETRHAGDSSARDR